MPRRPPSSMRRQFARQLIWIGLVFVAFYAFMAVGGPNAVGEWFGEFYTPGG